MGIALLQPGFVRFRLFPAEKIAFVEKNEIRLYQLGVQQILHIASPAVSKKVYGPRFRQHCKRRQIKLSGKFFLQTVVHMLQGAHSKPGDIGDDQLTALPVISVQPVRQILVLVADAGLGHF